MSTNVSDAAAAVYRFMERTGAVIKCHDQYSGECESLDMPEKYSRYLRLVAPASTFYLKDDIFNYLRDEGLIIPTTDVKPVGKNWGTEESIWLPVPGKMDQRVEMVPPAR